MYARVGSARLDVKFVMDDLALRSDGDATEQMCDEVIALIRLCGEAAAGRCSMPEARLTCRYRLLRDHF